MATSVINLMALMRDSQIYPHHRIRIDDESNLKVLGIENGKMSVVKKLDDNWIITKEAGRMLGWQRVLRLLSNRISFNENCPCQNR